MIFLLLIEFSLIVVLWENVSLLYHKRTAGGILLTLTLSTFANFSLEGGARTKERQVKESEKKKYESGVACSIRFMISQE